MKPFYLYLPGFLAFGLSGFSFFDPSGGGPASDPLEPALLIADTCFVDTSICPGDLLLIGGQAISEPGTYVFTTNLPEGCDSVLLLNVSGRNQYETFLDIDFCHGEHVRFGNRTFGKTGFYEILRPALNGCDTIIYLDLLVSNIGFPTFETQADDGAGNGAIDLSMTGNGLTYHWSNEATTEDLDGLAAGEYQVTITNSDSCQVVRTVRVKRLERFAVPNAFTPNGDGINDFFNLVANEEAPKVLAFRVYNRWGRLVYDNDDPERGWGGAFNGEPQPADTYFYTIQVARQVGPEELLLFQGDVSLLR